MLEENVQNLMGAEANTKELNRTKKELRLWKHSGLNPHFKSRRAGWMCALEKLICAWVCSP